MKPSRGLLADVRWDIALVLLALLAPLAGAQTPTVPAGVVDSQMTVSVEDPARALQPGRFEALNVLVNYRPGNGAVPAPGPDPTSETNATQRTKVHLAVKQMPSWVANATFAQDVLEMNVDSRGGNSAAVVVLVLGIAPDAPALQREEIIVTATADPNGNVKGSTGESPPVKLRGAIVAKINVTSPDQLVVPGGRWTVFPFSIRNDGNAELKVKLNVTARPQDSQVEFPQTVTIPRNGTEVVEVRLRVPWTYAIGGIVELEATPLLDAEEGKSARSETDVLGQSAVPFPSWIVAVGGALLLARGRTRRPSP